MRRRALAVVVVIMACSSAEEGPTAVESGVDADTAVVDLTEEQATAICDAAREAAEALVVGERGCTVGAILLSESEGVCTAAAEVCAVTPKPEVPTLPEAPACPLLDEANRTDCAETVGTLEACLTASVAASRTLLEGLSCDIAGKEEIAFVKALFDAGLSAFSVDPNEVPSCVTVAAACPALLPGPPAPPGS